MLISSFTKHKNFLWTLFFTGIVTLFSSFLPNLVQNGIALIGILTVGILHGANDLKILNALPGKKKYPTTTLFVSYIGVVILGIGLFSFLPLLGLISFVGVSCYHFGEQHWQGKLKPKGNPFPLYIFYGGVIFFLLFTFQYNTTTDVIQQMTQIYLPFSFFWMGLALLFLLFFLTVFRYTDSFIPIFEEMALLAVFAILFANSTLVFGFAYYFVVWHSLPSLKEQVHYLYQQTAFVSYYQYFKTAAMYWVLAIMGLCSSYFFFEFSESQYLTLLFSFLAAITFPHVVVMGWMFNSKK